MTRFSARRATPVWVVLVLAVAAGLVPALVAPATAATATVIGTVTRTGGEPVAGAKVTAVSTDGATTVSTTADASGDYAFTSLPAKSYRFLFRSSRTVTQWYGGGETEDSGTVVPVAGTTEVSPAVKNAGEVVGTWSGADDVSLDVIVAPNLAISYLKEVGDGQFRFWLTTERPVLVGLGDRGGNRYKLWYGDKYDRTHSETIQVDGDEVRTGVHFTFPETATVTGRTLNEAGVPISLSVSPYVQEDGSWVRVSGTTTSAQGSGAYTLGAPAGEVVTLNAGGTNGFASTWLGGTSDAAQATTLELQPDESRMVDDLTVPGGAVGGTAQDVNAHPVGGIGVTAYRGRTDEVVGEGVTGADGHWSIPGLAGGVAGPVTLRYDGEHVETVWGGDAATQDEATLFDTFPWGLRQTVTHLPEFRVQPSTAPGIVGNGYIGTWLEVVPGSGASPTPSSTEYRWFCNGEPTSETGTRFPVTGNVFACTMTVQQLSILDGYATGAAMSEGIPVKYFTITDRGYLRPAVVGRRMVPTGLTWTLQPDRIDYQWLRDGAPVAGATASSYVPRPADVGHRMSVRTTAYRTAEGVKTTWTSRRSAVVRAQSVLRASAEGRRGKAIVTYRLTTPGTSTPAGTVTISRDGQVLRRIAVSSTPQTRTWTWAGVRRGWKTLTLTYSGSPTAVATVTRVRVYVR